MKRIGRIRDGIRRFCNEHDRMSRSFGKSVKKAVKAQREAGLSVARYDAERKAPYFEYPDGRRAYDLSRPICPAAAAAETDKACVSGVSGENTEVSGHG